MRNRTSVWLFLFALLLTSPLLLAQDDDEDAPKKTTVNNCKDSKVLTTMPGCRVRSCDTRDFDSVALATKRGQIEDEPIKTTVEGAKETYEYVCDQKLSAVQLSRNAQNALTTAGFTTVFTGKDTGDDIIFTARKGGQWVEIIAGDNIPDFDGYGYRMIAVRTQEMQQVLQASAMESAINSTGRVSVYGINFDTGKATLRPESDKVLQEIASLMKKNASWKLLVEGHTDNVGTKAANLKLSQDRAASVVAWLVANGIDRTRLTPQGFGDSKPVAPNTYASGREKNRRVELVKQ